MKSLMITVLVVVAALAATVIYQQVLLEQLRDKGIYHMNDNIVFETMMEDMSACEYNCTGYEGVCIPSEVDVYFIRGIYDLIPNDDHKTYGTYGSKEIRVLAGMSISEKDILRHELAHYSYEQNLTQEDKEYVAAWYDRFCENPSEFYAYTVQHYGEFKWLEELEWKE